MAKEITKELVAKDLQRTDLYKITPDQFSSIRFPNMDEEGKELKKLNKRQDFSHLPSFTAQIVMDGAIEVPVTGYIKDGLINITDGECRCRAAMMAFNEYVDEKKNPIVIPIPFITEKRGTTLVDRLYKQIRLNNQRKDFTPVEEAAVIAELINQGQDESSILDQLQYSKVYLSNLKLLQKAPDKIKTAIGKNIISSTLAMDILRSTKNFDEAIQLIEDAIAGKGITAAGESAKITKKDIVKTQGKVNSYSAIRKAIMKAEKGKLVVRMDKINEYQTYKDIVDGKISYETFVKDFFEPTPEKEKKSKKSKKQEEMTLEA